MKKIVILITIILICFLPQIVVASGCERKKTEVIKNELPCIKIPKENCGGVIEFKNECEEEVFYTNLKCWSDGYYESYKKDGYTIINNEVTLSRKYFSSPVVSKDAEYFGRINFLGGAWLPCKAQESFYNPVSKQITVKFRKSNKIYEVVAHIPYAPDRVNKIKYFGKYSYVAILIFCILLIQFLVIYTSKKKNKK